MPKTLLKILSDDEPPQEEAKRLRQNFRKQEERSETRVKQCRTTHYMIQSRKALFQLPAN